MTEENIKESVEEERSHVKHLGKLLRKNQFHSFLAIGGTMLLTALEYCAVFTSPDVDLGNIIAVGSIAIGALLSLKVAVMDIEHSKLLKELKNEHLANIENLSAKLHKINDKDKVNDKVNDKISVEEKIKSFHHTQDNQHGLQILPS